MGRRTELRDLRSLERRSMYSIFHPLDADERLPRELILEGKRHRLIEIRYLEVLGFLYLPALLLAIIVMGTAHINGGLAFAVAGLLALGFLMYALIAKFR
jgi:alkylation response protein AidB-like acyl-CoA dehydrogenase